MKSQVSAIALASLLALSASLPALSADLSKTAGDPTSASYEAPLSSRSGFYVTGALGIAAGDRDGYGAIATDKHGTVVLDAEGQPTDEDTVDDGKPLAGLATGDFIFSDLLEGRKSDRFEALVYGGEISYLLHLPNRRFGVEFGLGATVYGDNELKAAFGGNSVVTAKGDVPLANAYPDVGEEQRHGQLGTVSFQRDYDIDLVAKGHYFVADNISLYAGGGLSWAQGSASASHASNYSVAGQAEGVFDHSFKKDDSALGYVLLAGAQMWATDQITIGVEYSYKHHEFDVESGKSTDAAVFGDAYRYGVSDKIEVEDDVHAVKARIGIKLN